MPVSLRVRLRFANLDAFANGYATNLTRNGVFLEGVPAQPADSVVRFELLLADGTAALRGEGRVLWSRGSGAQTGVAVRFTRLDARSKQHIDEWFKRSMIRPGSIPPPLPRSVPPPPRTYDVHEGASVPPHRSVPPPPPSPAPPRPSRASLSELEAELETLARNAPPSRDRREPATRSLSELEADLERLSREPAYLARNAAPAPVSARASQPPSARSRPPVAGDYNDIPAVLGMVGEDGTIRSALTPPPPPRINAARPDHPSTVPPEAMREPTPVPEADEEAVNLASGMSIPQAPLLPRTDAQGTLEPADALPDLDLGESEATAGAEPVAAPDEDALSLDAEIPAHRAR